MKTENIVKYLQEAYTDEKLAALLAHAQDGKLGYGSCCCFIGAATADHALRQAQGMAYVPIQERVHYSLARFGQYEDLAKWAEQEFRYVGSTDAERRAAIIPLIEAEIARREELKQHTREFNEMVEMICG